LTIEADETLEETVNVGLDLVLSSIDVEPDPLHVNEYATINAEITNTGNYAIEDSVVRFYNGDPDDNGIQIGSDEVVPFIAADDVTPVLISWSEDSIDEYEIYVVCDATDIVDETNEGNNNDHTTLSVETDAGLLTISGDTFTQCTNGIYLDQSSPDITGCTFDECDYSVYCNESSPKIISCNIYSPANAPVYANQESSPVLVNTHYARALMEVVDEDSSVSIIFEFCPTVVDSNGDGISGVDIEITGSQEDLIEVTTDSNGKVDAVQLMEFIQNDDEELECHSPYVVSMTLGTTENHFPLAMTGSRNMTIHSSGDSDIDGIIDDNECPYVYSFEAEDLISESGQAIVEESSSGGMVVVKSEESDTIIDAPLMYVDAGTYKCYFLARAENAGSELSVDITSIDVETYKLTEIYRWYYSDDISLDEEGDICIKLQDLDGGITVDKIMIAQLKNGAGTVTGILGQISDPTVKDTDMDELPDGSEVNVDEYWLEAEDSPSGTGTIVDDATGTGNGKAISMDDEEDFTFSVPVLSIKQENYGNYLYKIRAKIEGTITSANLKLEPCIDGDSQNYINQEIKFNYEWYSSDEFEVSSSDTVTLKLTASIVGTGHIYADRAILYKNGNNPPTSDPLTTDSDEDGLNDGDETGVFWKIDRIETEDHSSDSNNMQEAGKVIHHQFSDNLTMTAMQGYSFVELGLTISEPGTYKISADGMGNLEFKPYNDNSPEPGMEIPFSCVLSGAENDELLEQSIIMELHSSSTTISSTTEIKEIKHTSMYTKPDPEPYSEIIIVVLSQSWHVEQDYEITESEITESNGDFHIILSLIMPALGGSYIFDNDYEAKLSKVDINNDYIMLEKQVHSALNFDSDKDGLSDGQEISLGYYPLNSDPDKDGISDANELELGLNPELRDSDSDGVRDRVELGYSTYYDDPYTSWDTQPINQDQDTETTTDPLNSDTDGDGLPDGAVEGWGLNYYRYIPYSECKWGPSYGNINWENNWDSSQCPWEWEDLNGNGEMGDGESNPMNEYSDADVMPDGYERWFSLDPCSDEDENGDNGDCDLGSQFIYITPWQFIEGLGAGPISDSPDNLINKYEYICGLNPRLDDTDGDKLIDGGEVPAYMDEGYNTVVFRTNVPDGARKWDNYGSIQSTETIEWVWVLGEEYWYEEYVENADVTTNRDEMAIAPDVNLFNGELPTNMIFVACLQDKTVILLSSDYRKVFVWEPNTLTQDFFDSYPNNILNTGDVIIYYIKSEYEDPQAPSSDLPDIDFNNKEIYFGDPLSIDSDCDGRNDGQEMYLMHYTGNQFAWNDIMSFGQESRNYDTDLDGWSNARDLDSDNDYLADSDEANCLAWNYNPLLGKTNAYNYDTDGDSGQIHDVYCDYSDTYPLDFDNDGLTGFDTVNNIYGTYAQFGGQESKYGCSFNDFDDDDDHLLDAYDVTLDNTKDFDIEIISKFTNINHVILYVVENNLYTFYGELSIGTNPANHDTDAYRNAPYYIPGTPP
jgi:hypothetical protein